MFKSYISVDFDLPWEDDDRAQEKYWEAIYEVQKQAEREYQNAVRRGLSKLGIDDIEIDMESK